MRPSSASSGVLPPDPGGRLAAALSGREDLAARPWFAPVLLGVGWILLGGMAGLQVALLGGPDAWPARAGAPLLAGALWVPVTFGATLLARRVRWSRTRPGPFLAVHGTASLATSFALNAAFFLLPLAAGSLTPAAAAALAVREGVRWLHLNAAGYWTVVAVVHLLDHRHRGRSRPDRSPPDEGRSGARTAPGTLELPSGTGHVRIPLPEIDWIEADGDYARVHAAGRSYLLSERMKALEARLAPAGFSRVHRSAIVNEARVREMRHRTHGDYDAILLDGTVVRVSRSRRPALDHLFPRGGSSG